MLQSSGNSIQSVTETADFFSLCGNIKEFAITNYTEKCSKHYF